MSPSFVGEHRQLLRAAAALTLLLVLAGCGNREKAVSGTIEVDEAHVGPRAGGRVEKILHWEGDHLHEGQLILQLDASELRARRDLANAQINTALHDADAQQAQLVFLNDEARRQKDLLTRKVVSSSDAERADSSAKTQEKNLAAAQMRVAQARAQLADIDAQLAEMQVVAPSESIFPRETMPWIFYAFGALFPTTYFIALMRAIILRGANFFEYWPNLAIFIVMSALLFAFCASRFRTKIA